ncbi:MAG: hypothetical protein AAFP98_02060 [Pseudomonadota bacterium]
MKHLLSSAIFAALAGPVAADVTVSFRDGAPKDRFVIASDVGICADAGLRIAIDLTPTMGQLIFDITGAGQGVEVFQPFELVSGGGNVTGVSEVTDGDKTLSVEVNAIQPGAEVAFTIDVDDTIGAREITVTGSEIAGGLVQLTDGTDSATGIFGEDGVAKVAWPACVS